MEIFQTPLLKQAMLGGETASTNRSLGISVSEPRLNDEDGTEQAPAICTTVLRRLLRPTADVFRHPLLCIMMELSLFELAVVG